MLPAWLIALASAAYLGLLFVIARFGDARADAGRSVISANVYALSIAVYCTSWTYYGSVGRAASEGLGFLPVYLGPTLIFLFSGVAHKMLRISKALHITSIADFVASRYGKSQALAVLVTVIAVIGVVPYIALQLKAVSASLDVLFQRPDGALPWWRDSTLLIAAVMAIFAILFGTRHLDATERHEGMVAAIAFESLVKLVAFFAVGLFVVYGVFDGFGDLFARAAAVPDLAARLGLEGTRPAAWVSVLLLSAFAVLFLPRQFQITVVENVDESHLKRAVWLFPLYLLAINLFVLPLALAGSLSFGGQAVDADTFVLTLPYSQGQPALTLLAFLGGLSAATAMLVVETIALSTMICNDLVMPFLLRHRRIHEGNGPADFSGPLLGIRRVAIAVIVLLGYLYFRLAGEARALVGIGLISFAAVAQFAPAILGGMYWKHGTRLGALAGLAAGFAVWLYTLLLPSFADSGWIDRGFVDLGPWGIGWLKAQALFGLEGLDEISHCLFWSLFANAGLYLAVSVFGRQTAVEASQAARFVDVFRHHQTPIAGRLWRGEASSAELVRLLERFLGQARAHRLLTLHARGRGAADWRQLPADAEFIQFAETRLAAAIGSASARILVGSALKEEALGRDEVLDMLDEASQVRSYSRELEKKSRQLQAATAELTRANERLLELDRMKDDFISNVSHELRTPLTAIRSLSETLAEADDLSSEDRGRLLQIVVGETERLSRLIDQILDIAKLRSGRMQWRQELVDVGQVVRSALASVQTLAREKSAQVSCDLPSAGPVVAADTDRLAQVVVNLLANAVKFVPDGGGRIAVTVRPDSEHGRDLVRVEVADNGPGVPPDEREAIFERFRQGGNTLTDKPRGTGLGLAISREIVQYFGGRLWVEAAEDAGARFVFVLPRQQDGVAPRGRESGQAMPAAGDDRRSRQLGLTAEGGVRGAA